MHIKLTVGSWSNYKMRLYLEASLDIVMMFYSFILGPSLPMLRVALDVCNLVSCRHLEEMGPIPVIGTARHGVDEHRCYVLCCHMETGCYIHEYSAYS